MTTTPLADSTLDRPLAIITGASSGIGYHLARCALKEGYDLLLAADTALMEAVDDLRDLNPDAHIEALQVELALQDGLEQLINAIRGRRVEILAANAGHGLGGAFLDQDFREIQHVINTNVSGTLYLVQKVARLMKVQNFGRILITGSIAGFQPGSFHAVYNGSKAFIDSFAAGLRNELKDSGITVTCLMPGATDTEFFKRADMMDTKLGQSEDKDDPAEVAAIGFKAMMEGEGDVVTTGMKNKMIAAFSKVMPSQMLAEQHRKMAEPGSAYK